VAFRRVARIEDIPDGRGLRVRVDGVDIGLFRVDGEIHALENACPHAGDPLSEGSLDGSILTCASHGWRFDVRTGFRPRDPDGFPIPLFAVRTRAGDVEVDLHDVLNPPPERRKAER